MKETQSCIKGAILNTWAEHEWQNGIQLQRLDDMTQLTVVTEYSTYEITVICGHTGEILVRGGKFFPEFTEARLAGSTLGGSFLKLLGIYAGFSMEIHFADKLIVTSRVRTITSN